MIPSLTPLLPPPTVYLHSTGTTSFRLRCRTVGTQEVSTNLFAKLWTSFFTNFYTPLYLCNCNLSYYSLNYLILTSFPFSIKEVKIFLIKFVLNSLVPTVRHLSLSELVKAVGNIAVGPQVLVKPWDSSGLVLVKAVGEFPMWMQW